MCRLKFGFLALPLLVLTGPLGFAQKRSGAIVTSPAEIQVRVSYPDERRVGPSIEVELLNAQSISIGQAFTDSEGHASFQISGGGVFRARASGTSIETTVSDAVEVQSVLPHGRGR